MKEPCLQEAPNVLRSVWKHKRLELEERRLLPGRSQRASENLSCVLHPGVPPPPQASYKPVPVYTRLVWTGGAEATKLMSVFFFNSLFVKTYMK